MLSFTVAHDTVINIMQPDEHTSFTHYIDENVQSQECNSDGMDEIHSMLHFEALVSSCSNSFIQPPTKKQSLIIHLLTHLNTKKLPINHQKLNPFYPSITL